MAQSMNTHVDYTVGATSYMGVASYGKVMVGDKAFEFYNEKNVEDYIQIPWDEIDHVAASILFGGKWIPRFAIVSKRNGTFSFSTRDNKHVLSAMKKYVASDRLVRSLSFFETIKRGLKAIFSRKKRNVV